MKYRSRMVYTIIKDTEENKDVLEELGYSNPMGHNGLMVIYDDRNQMISGILSEQDCSDLFEEIPEVQPA